MATESSRRSPLWFGLLHGLAIPLFLLSGCGSPSGINIELRKENQKLQQQVTSLHQEIQADENVIRGLRDRQGTLPTLPTNRLDRLFTTHGIGLGRLTGQAHLDQNNADGLLIYIYLLDQSGGHFKAAGSFTIEAFDLDQPGDNRIGRWTFDVEQSKNYWIDVLLEFGYALPCPWQKLPRHPNVTVKVTFLDELTQTPFTAQRVIPVTIPLTAPATQPK